VPWLKSQSLTSASFAILEELRGRGVVVLPTADHEPGVQLAVQAAEHVRRQCSGNEDGDLQAVDAAVKVAADATLERWKAERFRNDTSYMHMAALGGGRCREIMCLLPGDAFADGNKHDLRIYAQAWSHGADMLAGPNRKTVLRPVLKTHLERRGGRCRLSPSGAFANMPAPWPNRKAGAWKTRRWMP